jgi:hypothetical protein
MEGGVVQSPGVLVIETAGACFATEATVRTSSNSMQGPQRMTFVNLTCMNLTVYLSIGPFLRDMLSMEPSAPGARMLAGKND